ncbi:MAG: hypothetical protein RKO25_00540 [Candidatus Contendobacter sp.]|nr:hypothetical protein [Candidatus Contendobacter sp.]
MFMLPLSCQENGGLRGGHHYRALGFRMDFSINENYSQIKLNNRLFIGIKAEYETVFVHGDTEALKNRENGPIHAGGTSSTME